LVGQITPMIAQRLMRTPAYYGDVSRVKTAPNASLNNTLFNTSSGDIIVMDDE
jgi:hypothetical protein